MIKIKNNKIIILNRNDIQEKDLDFLEFSISLSSSSFESEKMSIAANKASFECSELVKIVLVDVLR